MNNHLPNFSNIKPENIERDLDQLLADNRARIATLLAENTTFTWENLITPLEALAEKLSTFWSPISHLHAVADNEALRQAYQACLPKLSAYSTEIAQNKDLYNAVAAIHTHASFKQLNTAQQKLITNELRDFHLAGVDLEAEDKKRYAEIQAESSKLTNHFEENVLDATQAWNKHITDEKELAGIPPHAIANARSAAQQKNLSGWLLTLDAPCYQAVMGYADNRALREEMYHAYCTRASDQGPNAGKFDNSELMVKILKLRQEAAQLLKKTSYAELSLATKMAKQPQEVLNFIHDLVSVTRAKALEEFHELQSYAQKNYNLQDLKSWDVGYYSEKLREQHFGINDEMLRPYFPENKVLEGLFSLVKRLYGLQIIEIKDFDSWHPDVRLFEIRDKENFIRGKFYLDLYARERKRGGAWMDHYCNRLRLADGTLQTPIAYLTCNLTKPNNNQPALFSHDEVTTLFHEFGHGLHHMLTKIDYAAVGGINGVAWDAVELPSQFMEFFVWEKSVLAFISGHYQTGKPLPDELIDQMIAAKNFHTGLYAVRQLEFAWFDFQLHLETNLSQGAQQIQTILNNIRAQLSAYPVPNYNRFQHSFTHIFSGGYAAGYYSYLWAEVLASDVFAKFEEAGILDPATGQQFLKTILEQGGSKDALELFIDFRGRPPSKDAWLRHNGITTKN